MNQQAFVFYLDTFDAAVRGYRGDKAAEALMRVAKAAARDERMLFGIYEKVRAAVGSMEGAQPEVAEPILAAADKAFSEYFPIVKTPHAYPAMALSQICDETERPAEAVKWDRRVLEILGRMRHDKKQAMIASSRLTLAQHLFDITQFDEAMTEAAAVVASDHADDQHRAAALTVQADCHRAGHRFDESLELRRQVLVFYEDKIKPLDHVQIVSTLLVMVTLQRDKGEYSDAILLAERALKTAEAGDMGPLANGVICDNLGQLWQERAHLGEAMKYLQRARELYTEGDADEVDIEDVGTRIDLLDALMQAKGSEQ